MSSNIVYDFDPRNLPPEFLNAIGLAVAGFAQTEKIIELAIAGCLGVDAEYGAALTTHMPGPLRFSVLRSVAEIRIGDLNVLDELDNHLEELETASNKRNSIIHNQWYRDSETGNVFTVKEKARTRYEMELIPMTIDSVKGDALFIYQTGMNFMAFLTKNGLLPSLPSGRTRAHKSKAARKRRRSKK